MRVPVLLLMLVTAALLASGCAGGPQDSDQRLSEACERQIEQISEAEDEGDTPTAESTEERLGDVTLVECAGQETKVVAADAETGGADAEAKGEDSTTDEGGDDAPAEGEGEGDAVAEEQGGDTKPVALDEEARSLFADTCGGCHTLSDAETSGAVGPNLDETELDSTGVADKIAEGGGGMPPNLLEGEAADAVAEYVAAAAAQS